MLRCSSKFLCKKKLLESPLPSSFGLHMFHLHPCYFLKFCFREIVLSGRKESVLNLPKNIWVDDLYSHLVGLMVDSLLVQTSEAGRHTPLTQNLSGKTQYKRRKRMLLFFTCLPNLASKSVHSLALEPTCLGFQCLLKTSSDQPVH